MSLVHWFNPENDLALATGATNYTPKRAAQQLHDAGAVLPLWYADDDDYVLCYGVNGAWLRQMRADFGIKAQLFDHEPVVGQRPDPWGWSAYARRFFVDEGFSADTMPSVDRIEAYRDLSHRRTSIKVADMLREMLPDVDLAPPAVEPASVDQARQWLSEHPRAYIKFPWSSSGRGVFDVASAPMDSIMKMVDDSVRRQGSVMLEVAYDRAMDFARLFECRDGRCYAVGTSVFSTDEHDSYTGNILGSDDFLLSLLSEHCDKDTLLRVFEALRLCIEQLIAPVYDGVLGVDMLIARDGVIDAVVEINLRKTMGWVARKFADRYLDANAKGVFRISPRSLCPDLQQDYTASSGRLQSGTLILTPESHNFVIYVCID